MGEPHRAPPLGAGERAQAVTALVDRVGALQATVGDRVPVARPQDGGWLLSRRGSWSAGCWAGALRLRALVLGTAQAAEDDRAAVSLLSRSAAEDTSARATIFWLGAAARDDGLGAEQAVHVARRLVADFDAALGLLPDGSGLGHGEAGRRHATVDAGFAVAKLLRWADDRGVEGAAEVAAQHTAVLLGGVGADGAAHAAFGGGPPALPRPPAGGWARGQAWALLTAVAAGADPDGPRPHPAAARLAAHRTARPVPPPDDLTTGDGPPDTGAAAIDAVALLALAEQDGDRGTEYRAEAAATVAALVRGHLVGGELHDGAYRLGAGGPEVVESVWGQFFLLAALLVLDGVIPADSYC